MRHSAGTLLHRSTPELEVLIVHPSGNYNKNKPWSIPKGMPDAGEGLEAAARRETIEETGVVAGDLQPLGHVDLPSRKRVHCYYGPAPEDAEPHTASWEVDRAEFMPIEQARRLLHPEQAKFIDRLMDALPDQSQS